MAAENAGMRLTEIVLTPHANNTHEGSIFSPEKNKRIVTPIPRENFYVHGNGIDIKAGRFANGKGTDYERECFKKITSVNHRKNSLILGPHFIDEVFSNAFNGQIRPDALQFNADNEAVWVLSNLYEFKSGNLNGPVRKLHGFSRLLTEMREDEEKLPSVFKQAMPWAKEALPSRIIVPAEKNIQVIFVSQELTHKTVYDATVPPFPLAHVHFTGEQK